MQSPATTALNQPRRASLRPRRAGWSLIELLVVVGIIAILLAILINTAAESRGPVEQTKVTLKALMAIYDEYEVSTRRVPGTAASGAITQFCADVNKFDRTRKMLAALGKDVAIDNLPATPDGFVDTVRDGWGVDIRYSPVPTTGTIGFKGPYFASAGPDGKWGTITAATNLPDTDAKDNLYSFSLGD